MDSFETSPISSANIRCSAIDLATVRQVEPIESSFTSKQIYVLDVREKSSVWTWRLRERRLQSPLSKVYDRGKIEQLLGAYEGAVMPEEMRFVQAGIEPGPHSPVGLATWQDVRWNDTIWLIDIRVRAQFKRLGVGTALLESIKDSATRMRKRGITVETQTNNYPAIRFYRQNGFELSGFNPYLYTNRDLEGNDVALFLFWKR